MGVVPPRPGFLETLREVTRENGILLIFDEVITGFRVAYGGWQTLTGIVPDLTCLGKIIGGGLPVGALGGRREIMEHLAPTGPVYQAGTLSGNPLAMAAGIATLDILKGKSYRGPRKNDRDPLRRIPGSLCPERESPSGSTASAPCSPSSSPADEVIDFASASRSDTERFARFFQGMLAAGIYSRPRPVRGRLRLLRPHGRRHRPDPRCLREGPEAL